MVTVCGVSAHAEGTDIRVSNFEELKAAVYDGGNQTTGRVIILENDITNTDGLRFAMPTDREITITSANPASPFTISGGDYYLCASGFDNSAWQGKVNLKNINLNADWGFWIYSGANISMENVKITCTMPNAPERELYSSYTTLGIDYTSSHPNNIPSTVTMKNSVIDPSSIKALNNGVDIYGNVNLTMTDCTILPGENSNTTVGYNSSGDGLGIRNADAQITLTNTIVTGGSNTAKEMTAGKGINLQAGTLTLNNSKIAGGTDLECGGTALYNHDGAVTINGGELAAGNDPNNWNTPRLIRKYSNASVGSVTVNPTLAFVDNKTVKMSPAIIGATVQFGDGATALVEKGGYAKRTTGVATIGQKAVLQEETVTMMDSFPIAIPATESLPLPESTVNITAKASIPSPTYTIIIPTAIDFEEQTQALSKYADQTVDQYGNPVTVTKPFTVKAENIGNLFDDLGKEPRIDVVISFDGNMTGSKDQSVKIPYTVKKGDSEFVSGGVFTSFKNPSDLAQGETNTADGTVSINRTSITTADSYTGTMTFTISIPTK